MRINQPVTQREYRYDSRITLLSATDTDSRIRYANPAFVKVSGFSREELDGQPHNLVRHPDMPPQAFADMWASLRAGRSWSGLVKNRRRNGDHYWVRANVTPMVRDGVTHGYMSVRTSPGRDEVEATERIYSRINEGRGDQLYFHQGLVLRRGFMGFLASLPRLLPARWRLRLCLALVPLASALVCLFAGLGAATAALVVGVTVLSAGLADWMLERQFASPLAALAEQAQRVASGARAADMQPKRVDELGHIFRSVNQAGLNLAALVDDVGTRVEGMYRVANEIAGENQELSGRTEQSAASVVETAAALEQLAAAVAQNTDSSRQAARLAAENSRAAEAGGQVMSEVIDTMRAVTESARRVTGIVDVIESIALQTSILALNASVEAARAGEQGRGFAVVAGEVRNLAGRCSQASREIRELIETSVARAQAGAELVDRAGESMSEMVDRTRQVNALIEEISHASQEQSLGMNQVSVAIEQIDRATQQNAALVSRNYASSEQLRALLSQVVDAIAIYRNDRPVDSRAGEVSVSGASGAEAGLRLASSRHTLSVAGL